MSFCLHTVALATSPSPPPPGTNESPVDRKVSSHGASASSLQTCLYPFPQFVLAAPLPDEARRTGNERSCTMTSTSAFFTATIAATPTQGAGETCPDCSVTMGQNSTKFRFLFPQNVAWSVVVNFGMLESKLKWINACPSRERRFSF